jgi:hypothetical protein
MFLFLLFVAIITAVGGSFVVVRRKRKAQAGGIS